MISALLLASACSTNADVDAETGVDAEVEVSAAFCEDANAFITDRTVTDVSGFSESFFAGIDERLAALEAMAPADALADVMSLRSGFAEADAIFAEFDYDTADQQLGPALLAVDNEGLLAATENLQTYLAENCEITAADTGTETAVVPEEVEAIMDAFDVDRAMAECLNAEFGDLAAIPSEELTPELLSRPACGTTLIALLSGG